MSANDLFSLQGSVMFANRLPNGGMGTPNWAGNTPKFEVQFKTTAVTKNESFTGNRLAYGRLITAKEATVNMTLDEWMPSNVLMALYGDQVSIATTDVTDEPLPDELVAGDMVRLDSPFVLDVVLTDATGKPLPDGAWRVHSQTSGTLEVLNADAGSPQPWKAAYKVEDATSITMFTSQPPERWIYLEGINTVNQTQTLVDLYRVQLDPINTLSLINEGYGDIQLTGSMLYDQSKALDPAFGGFGRMVQRKTPVVA